MKNVLDGFVPYVPGTRPKKGSTAKTLKNELTGKSGCYAVNVKVSGKIYVGSTSNLAGRVTTNLNTLNYNTHGSKDLQKAYNNNPDVVVWVKPTETIEEARLLEQEIVDKLLPTGNLTNTGVTDVTRPCLGMVHSKETRLKISEAQLGKVLTEEHKQNMSISRKEFFSTDEGKAVHARGIEKKKHQAMCKGVIYPSIVEAAKALGVCNRTIINRCENDNFPDYFKIDKTI